MAFIPESKDKASERQEGSLLRAATSSAGTPCSPYSATQEMKLDWYRPGALARFSISGKAASSRAVAQAPIISTLTSVIAREHLLNLPGMGLVIPDQADAELGLDRELRSDLL